MRTDTPDSQRRQKRFNQHLKFLSHHLLILNLILLFISKSTYSKIAENPYIHMLSCKKRRKYYYLYFLFKYSKNKRTVFRNDEVPADNIYPLDLRLFCDIKCRVL